LEQELDQLSEIEAPILSSPTHPLHAELKNEKKKIVKNTLTFCDLAGSERVHRVGPSSNGIRLREAQNINRSICALGNCIQALAIQSSKNRSNVNGVNPFVSNPSVPTHIPFRDSKLTRLLSESLSGNSRTCIIATIGPCSHSYEETLSTLIFATRAAAVRKSIRKVKPVSGIFADLSETVQGWKWPPLSTTGDTPEEKDFEDLVPEQVEEEFLPPLPPPPLIEEAPLPLSVKNFLSISSDKLDPSYLFPAEFGQLGSDGDRYETQSILSSNSPTPTRLRRHSFSALSSDQRRPKVQLHPTIALKRQAEELELKRPLSQQRELEPNQPQQVTEERKGRRSSKVGDEKLNMSVSNLSTIPNRVSHSQTTQSSFPSLEMLAAEDYDLHLGHSPFLEPKVATPRRRLIQTPMPNQESTHSLESFALKQENNLMDTFKSTPSRHYQFQPEKIGIDDLASSLEKEIDIFRLEHDLHEVSPLVEVKYLDYILIS
jgi:hypothetical protein